MDFDEEELKVKKAGIVNLEVMSVEALNEYVLNLQLEIQRAEAEIDLKEKARKGAEDIFKH